MAGAARGESVLVDARRLSKRFGGELALDSVDFDLRRGEIHALLGENGAGKSTLIKILAGIVERDTGELIVQGRSLPRHFAAADSAEAGLAFVHQDLGLLDHLSVAENLALAIGYEHRFRLIAFRETEARAAAILESLSLRVSPRTLIGELAQDEKVMVAVARAFSLSARAIVLDEASSSLPAPEVARLADALRGARGAGVAFVYVTHRLGEIFGLADRVTVLRDGRKVATADVGNVDRDQVVAWVLGHAPSAQGLPGEPAAAGGVAPGRHRARLEVNGLLGPGLEEPISFTVGEGEVLALCGLVGSGAREVAALLGGALRPTAGSALLDGSELRLGSAAALRRVGCEYVPGDRQTAGAVAQLTVRDNLFLARHRGDADGLEPEPVVLRPRTERRAGRALMDRYDIRPRSRLDRLLATLSGGNQQKVILARALRRRPRLLVLDDPTAGVDIGSRVQIHGILRTVAAQGTAIVLASTDLDEVVSQADGALVMVHGRIGAELAASELSTARLSHASHGLGAGSFVSGG